MRPDAQNPPAGLLDRLQRLAGYTWDVSRQFRSSYGVWWVNRLLRYENRKRTVYVLTQAAGIFSVTNISATPPACVVIYPAVLETDHLPDT